MTNDMIKALKTPVNVEKAKATVRSYKQEYQDYKRRGRNKSYDSWIIDKGYGERQRPFLESILKEANQNKRQQLLEHANADQINSVSEMVLNLLKD